MKKIHILLTAAATVLFAQGLHAQTTPVVVDKTAADNGDGTYTLTLKTYVTGQLYDNSATRPSDIVFLLDVSKSLTGNVGDGFTLWTEVSKPITATPATISKTIKAAMTATKHDAVTTTYTKNATVATKAMKGTVHNTSKSQNWTYSGVKCGNAAGTANYSYFYKDANGDFYVVHKWSGLLNSSTGQNNVYAIGYVDKNGNTWYLTSDGVSSTYKDVTGTGTTLWNGTLYTSGWAYTTESHSTSDGGTGHYIYGLDYGNETATVAKQWYYLHTDGEYYPVRRANNLPDGNGNYDVYAAWVVIDGVTWYLHGDKLDTDYDRTIRGVYNASGTRPYHQSLYFGTLYQGGWTYTTILAASVENGHYAEYEGHYYPVQKGTEEVDGETTYQAFVEIPGVGKRYLFGTGLSENPCPYSTTTGIFFYFGKLYKGGWQYGQSDFYDATAQPSSGNIRTVSHYLHTDGQYYPIRKTTEVINGVTTYQAYVELPEGKYYFHGNGLASTPDTPYLLSTSKYVALYFGQLYKMNGWSSKEVTAATAGAGCYYLHSDNRYYPVMKESTPGTGYYQLYVDVPEGKRYLWGHSLHEGPCPYSASQYTIIWYGSLYKGGWSYSTITVNQSDKQGYSYLHTDGQYYPIFQETVTISGATTYQDYVILPDGNKWYLCGNEVSRDPYPYTLKNTVNNWFGPLYSKGWTYANIVAGDQASGHYYLHTDGVYYPVQKEDNGSGSTRYQAYVDIPGLGKRYLYGNGLSPDPYPFSARTNVGIYYGTLYTGGWTYDNITGTANTYYYLHTDNQYYPVTRVNQGSSAGKKRYQAKVELPNENGNGTVTRYLANSTISAEPYAFASTTTSSLYFRPLYQQKTETKMVGLQNALKAFINEMGDKSQQTGIKNRIALTQFGLATWTYAAGGVSDLSLPHLSPSTSANADRKASIIKDLTDMSVASNVSTLVTTATTTIESAAESTTAHRYGLAIANAIFRREGGLDETTNPGYNYDGSGSIDNFEKSLFNNMNKLNDDQKAEYALRPKIVIIIGDGVERAASNEQSAIDKANELKQNPNVKVYYVQVNAGTSTPSAFVQSISSGSAYCRTVDYYDDGLENALLAIAQEIGGDVVAMDGTNTFVQDVVAPEFSIPDGSEVMMYTANCTGVSSSVLQFQSEDDWASFNGTVTKTINADGTTTVRVSGFNFSENWCGNYGTELGYRGKQLIVRITIQPKDGIVGGVVATNTADSKVIMTTDGTDRTLKTYPIPTVSGIPIYIQISKSGLKKGDSAIFAIKRKKRGTNNAFADFITRIILTGNEEGTPVTAEIANLDPTYIYQIVEGNWSWTYNPTVLSITTEDQTTNPFVFGNTPKTNINYDNGEDESKVIW